MCEQLQEKIDRIQEQLENGRLVGKVWAVKGKYGFIRHYPESQPRIDYFFHGSDVQGVEWFTLENGDIVSFIPVNDDRGKRATLVNLECEKHLIQRRNDK